MKLARLFGTACLVAVLGSSVLAQDRQAPGISGMAVQGVSVNLDYFQGDKNVLVVFYRMHS